MPTIILHKLIHKSSSQECNYNHRYTSMSSNQA